MVYPYEVDKKITEILGKENSCIGKKKFRTLEFVIKARDLHNQNKHMNHKVNFYICTCGFYHLGGSWHVDDIKILFNAEIRDVEEREMYLSLLSEWWKFKQSAL